MAFFASIHVIERKFAMTPLPQQPGQPPLDRNFGLSMMFGLVKKTVVAAVIVAFAPLARAGPEELICSDPRAVAGGLFLGQYVMANEATAGLTITANATQYAYGETVEIKIDAVGDKFATGAWLAVQVDFTGANGEAMGLVHDLSDDLRLVTNCASGLYGVEEWGGHSRFLWTPSVHAFEMGKLETTGNATFRVLWTNAPDKSKSYADPYLYMKTVTLWDPTKWNPSSKSAGTTEQQQQQALGNASKCVDETPALLGAAHHFGATPVFLQKVGDDRVLTFPNDRCLKCLASAAECLSARVTCPTAPGLPVVERLWARSKNCEGAPTRVADVVVGDYVCPGASHWDPSGVDLERFVPKLLRDFPHVFPDQSEAAARGAVEAYRSMLRLVQQDPSQPVVPSKQVDAAWHSHILDTEAYARDSLRLFGKYLHHAPSFGGADEQAELVAQRDAMFRRLKATTGRDPRQMRAWTAGGGLGEWPAFDDQKAPDCCSAMCVKPDCAGCVGCNAIDCGFLGDGNGNGPDAKIAQLSPAQLAGYVPAATVKPHDPGAAPAYKCASTPHEKMELQWSIVGDTIYFKHDFKMEAWYGVGLANTSTHDMGDGVDYMVTMVDSGNYSDYVRDMYKWDAGNGWPCWDVLYECSPGNGTQGTPDLRDVTVARDHGYATASWNRKLDTKDAKDFVITDDFVRVLYAYGVEDAFTYHAQNFGECVLNFFSGVSQYCWWA